MLNSETGQATFNDAFIRGVLEGVTGSFKRLNCIDDNGNVAGGISFGSDGRMWLDGDIHHQGIRDGRPFRFYADSIWSGVFGASTRSAMVVYGSYAYYYPNGLGSPTTRVYVTLMSSTTSNNITYYTIQLSGATGDATGLPVDIVIFSTPSTYYYELSGSIGKTVKVVNAYDNNNGIYIYSNGYAKQLSGGSVSEFISVNGFLNPTPQAGTIGRGWLILTYYDNDW